ncbi:helix-turn-helix domain-containing protein [Cellulomonas sp. H30R-01]|uniref:helix-turn-helix transcriptional regulator n=1 Tax=Cellulomonas sp. H30R-01 TaxID=2704467 RepID=UPI00138C959A|nr:helix-turn-helix domain-containing protein [Cellulomonas sp. H30R-01]QHT55557.1 helix-turn-helix domain-containing protein [Cellulomonas sp. H30R-01]
MSATLPVAAVSTAATPESDAGTRERVLRLVAAQGPVSATELAARLDLTTTGIRRHLAVLESGDQIAVHDGVGLGPARRGRPARRYVVTSRGQAALSHRYSELAAQALRFLAETGGPAAVESFAEQRVRDLEQRLVAVVDAAGDDVTARARSLADGLTADGYAASARPVPGARAVQLCQGHCPVQDVAHEFPQLCEAEARAFSRILGVHVQRLATLAGGGHVCTTNIPTTAPTPAAPVLAPEGPTA